MTDSHEFSDPQVAARTGPPGAEPVSPISREAAPLRLGDRIASVGDSFAARLIPQIEAHGFSYLRTEPRHPAFAALPSEADDYDAFAAGYGRIETVRQWLQLLQRCRGTFVPAEDRWHAGDTVVDPFRPGLRYAARSDREFDVLRDKHLNATRSAFRRCSVLLLTLAQTQAWVSTIDGAVFPARPGDSAGTFDPEHHVLRTFTIAEVMADLDAAIDEFRALNPAARIIVMVSSMAAVANGRDEHVPTMATLAKSVLRVAADHAAQKSNVVYCPAYEIVTAPGFPSGFEADHRTPSALAIDAVVAALVSSADASGPIESYPTQIEPGPPPPPLAPPLVPPLPPPLPLPSPTFVPDKATEHRDTGTKNPVAREERRAAKRAEQVVPSATRKAAIDPAERERRRALRAARDAAGEAPGSARLKVVDPEERARRAERRAAKAARAEKS